MKQKSKTARGIHNREGDGGSGLTSHREVMILPPSVTDVLVIRKHVPLYTYINVSVSSQHRSNGRGKKKRTGARREGGRRRKRR